MPYFTETKFPMPSMVPHGQPSALKDYRPTDPYTPREQQPYLGYSGTMLYQNEAGWCFLPVMSTAHGGYTAPRLDFLGDLEGFPGGAPGIPQMWPMGNRVAIQPREKAGMAPWNAFNNPLVTSPDRYNYDYRPGTRYGSDTRLGRKERQYKPSVGYKTKRTQGG